MKKYDQRTSAPVGPLSDDLDSMKPCVFCGTSGVEAELVPAGSFDFPMVFFRCGGCAAGAPHVPRESNCLEATSHRRKAAVAWNQRFV